MILNVNVFQYRALLEDGSSYLREVIRNSVWKTYSVLSLVSVGIILDSIDIYREEIIINGFKNKQKKQYSPY